MKVRAEIAAGQVSCCPPLEAPALGELEATDLARQFKALADPNRLRLLSLVASRGDVCACELVDVMGLAQPTISHHLKVLREAGLVESQRRGRWIHYRPNRLRMAELKAAL